jgi:hypothetical protein
LRWPLAGGEDKTPADIKNRQQPQQQTSGQKTEFCPDALARTAKSVVFHQFKPLASHRDSLKAKKSVGLAAGLPVAYRHYEKNSQGA